MTRYSKVLFLCIYTVLLSLLVYIWKEIFFPSWDFEERFLEPHYSYNHEEEFSDLSNVSQSDINSTIHSLIYEEFSKKYKQEQQAKIQFRYIPSSLHKVIEYSYLPIAESFLYHRGILSMANKLSVFFHSTNSETRWRMRSGYIHIYGITHMKDSEFLSVLVHEFAHYYDVYTLSGNAFWDRSQVFYNIGWDSTNRMKKWLEVHDFVSGYSMTNKYEDFAESYIYYVLHNSDFFKKAEESEILMRKYNYFRENIFTRDQFVGKSFSLENQVKDYYWDITKIDTDVKKFLQYLQDDI